MPNGDRYTRRMIQRVKTMQANIPFVLYNVKVDRSETNDLYNRYPEKVKELKALLAEYVRRGRSTKGKPQKNGPVKKWAQMNWTEDLAK